MNVTIFLSGLRVQKKVRRVAFASKRRVPGKRAWLHFFAKLHADFHPGFQMLTCYQ
jgi:hypothetical protein